MSSTSNKDTDPLVQKPEFMTQVNHYHKATELTAAASPDDAMKRNPDNVEAAITAGPTTTKKKRFSFSSGTDGHGTPMFSNLEAAKARHMSVGYEDMRPKDGFIGTAFRTFVKGRTGSNKTGPNDAGPAASSAGSDVKPETRV